MGGWFISSCVSCVCVMAISRDVDFNLMNDRLYNMMKISVS